MDNPLNGEVLTPDEKLSHKPRWSGQTLDLKATIQNMALTRWPDNLAIIEGEDWDEFLNDLVTLCRQLTDTH